MSLSNRYESSEVEIDNTTKRRFFSSTLYPTIERSFEDIYIVANESDRLDLLAYKYYNNTKYWWIIAQANALGKGGFHITPGTQIRIPKNLSKILQDFNFLNESR